MLVMQEGDSLFGGLPIIDITYQQYIANPSAYHDPGVIVHITGFPTAGNMPADYVGYNNDLNMEDIGNIATKAIAKVEPSDTALYLHPVGTYFINKDGNACVTDVQISVGGAITLGTNCHAVSDGVANDINSNLAKRFNVIVDTRNILRQGNMTTVFTPIYLNSPDGWSVINGNYYSAIFWHAGGAGYARFFNYYMMRNGEPEEYYTEDNGVTWVGV